MSKLKCFYIYIYIYIYTRIYIYIYTPFFCVTTTTAWRYDYAGKLIVPSSIQRRQRAEFVNSDQPQRGKTFDEHHNSLDETAEELLAVKRLSAVWDHPPSTSSHPEAALQKLFSWRPLAAVEEHAVILNEVLEQRLASVQPRWIYLDNNISLSQYQAESRGTIIDWFFHRRGSRRRTPSPPLFFLLSSAVWNNWFQRKRGKYS